MLGSRTKQVFAYGKRNQRIINVSEDRDRLVKTTPSIFDDLDPAPQWAPIASRMKKRENNGHVKSKSPSPKAIRINRKKRLSPALSPARRRTRVAQLIESETTRRPRVIKPKSTTTKKEAEVVDLSPPRAPLASFPPNIPGSPAMPGKLKGARTPAGKGTPSGLKKPFSPFIDMDILVIDDKGETVSKERRVSRAGIEANLANVLKTGAKSKRIKQNLIVLASDDGIETIEASGLPKRPSRRVPLIVYSDDSESEGDVEPLSPLHRHIPLAKLQPQSHSKVEVEVPPPPYPIHSTTRVLPPPKTAFPTIHQPATPPYNAPARYQSFPSPVPKPRQLTPIRGGRKPPFAPPSPPSPFSDTDISLSFDFEGLSFSSNSADNISHHLTLDIPAYLLPLLEECHQESRGPIDFSSFIETFPFDPVVQSHGCLPSDLSFKKIGEASYSEVFGIGDVVLKVIPLREELSAESSNASLRPKMNVKYDEHGMEEDGPAPSDAKDVRKEIIVTRAMGEVCDGFVKLLKTYIVRGKYPEVLLKLWDEYHTQKGSESVRPDTFLVSQVYAIIVLPNGGPDLETYKFLNANRTGWKQACSIFWQVTKALAHAEQLVSFEHRDLHWGQILVKGLTTISPLKTLNQNQISPRKSGRLFMDDQAHGIQVTLIDLGLSRMDAGDGDGGERVHWTPFEAEVFMGEGDYQFDVYRMMKVYNGGSWEEFNPLTNVMWLHYLTLKLLHSKRLKSPAISNKRRNGDALPHSTTAFTEKDCYECLLDIEAWLRQCTSPFVPIDARAKGKGRKKVQASTQVKATTVTNPLCAGEVVAYAVKKGWVKALS